MKERLVASTLECGGTSLSQLRQALCCLAVCSISFIFHDHLVIIKSLYDLLDFLIFFKGVKIHIRGYPEINDFLQ